MTQPSSTFPGGHPVARRRRGRPAVAAGIAALALATAACTPSGSSASSAARRPSPSVPATARASSGGSNKTTATTAAPVPSTTTAEPTTSTSGTAAPSSTPTEGPVTSPPLPPPGPGFVPDHVTAVGDSVMLDYEGLLQEDVPGIAVTAAVSRGWTAGEAVLSQMKADGQLGAVVVVGLATNGPVTAAQFDSMMTLLSGASRVVFVNTRVDRTWQTSNNAVLAAGVNRYPRALLADWYSMAVANPGWLYTTQTHLPIDGTGAAALAALVALEV